ncbi:MAG: cyclic nucleotide-binding domain-containing protein [Acidobacteriota bacterium]
MLKWLRRKSIEDLIDEGEYQEAIDRIHAELECDHPPARTRPMRQVLGEVLSFLGRTEEAVEVLRPLVKEYLSENLVAKAIAIQKLLEEIDPMQKEVRFESIAQAATSGAIELPDGIDLGSEEGLAAAARIAEDVEKADRGESAQKPDSGAAGEIGAVGDIPAHVSSAAAKTPLFSSFSKDELRAVIEGLKLIALGPGEVVMIEDEPGSSLFVLTDGIVRIYVRSNLGHSVQIRELGAPAFFGEISVVHASPRTATVTCKTPCEFLELDRLTLDRIAQSHPGIRAVLKAFSDQRSQSAKEQEARKRG